MTTPAPGPPSPGATPRLSARALARAEVNRRILEAARARLTTEGAAGLSVRAIARDLGMVSSGVYRYVASRDDLLTELLVAGFDELGEAMEAADATVVDRDDVPARFAAIAHAFRDWARAHPSDFALLYGSPVPGYAAPDRTVGPATRVVGAFARLLPLASAQGIHPLHPPTLDEATAASLEPVIALAGDDGLDPRDVAAGVMGWTVVEGTVQLELFGHFHNGVLDPDGYFAHVVRQQLSWLGHP